MPKHHLLAVCYGSWSVAFGASEMLQKRLLQAQDWPHQQEQMLLQQQQQHTQKQDEQEVVGRGPLARKTGRWSSSAA